ncbi:MAG TPA: RNA polymerase sigma factor [Phycisphaerae bacterium]|nr:RNA polymerase sigma factor [Phycisphaerae bacterium]
MTRRWGKPAGAEGDDSHGARMDRVRRPAVAQRQAFEQIVSDHRADVTRLVQRLLAWPADVDDVVQDVFVSAWTNLRRFDGRSSLRTWLYAIAVNRCRSHHRRRRLRQLVFGGGQDEPVDAAEPSGGAAERERRRAVRAAVRALPRRLREVAVLRYLQEMPIAEIADVLKLGRNAVEVRLHRARERLRPLLRDWVEED